MSNEAYQSSSRPAIALITNHGYAGVEIPIGGAQDTGGQNLYVNSLADSLEKLGYKVTIFTRGGFPHFEGDRMRIRSEFLSQNIRYIFIPGGPSAFIRKEDIAIALDEEIEWVYDFINEEARQADCDPWRLYEFVNSHYWDAGVIAVRLIERWRNDIAARDLSIVLASVVSQQTIDEMNTERHWLAVGDAPGYTLGRLLLSTTPSTGVSIMDRVRAAASRWVAVRGGNHESEAYLNDTVQLVIDEVGSHFPPDLLPILAANTLGPAALSQCPDIDARLTADLHLIDTHVWTPHSLGELKDSNFRNRTIEIRRDLKFCERRDHERMICSRTRAFASTSTEMAEQLWTHYRVPVSNTFYFPPCLDVERFRVYEKHELASTYQYLADVTGLSIERLKTATIIFETSRMDRTKRKDVVIAAFEQAVADHPEAILIIGGGPRGEVHSALAELIRNNVVLNGRAFLLGPIPDEHIGPLFSLAELYVTPSEMEGFGMSASQAAAANTALISSNMVPFAVNHVPNEAVICPAGDVSCFANAISNLLENDEDRHNRAHQLAQSVDQFNWAHATEQFISHLREHCFRIHPGQTE